MKWDHLHYGFHIRPRLIIELSQWVGYVEIVVFNRMVWFSFWNHETVDNEYADYGSK